MVVDVVVWEEDATRPEKDLEDPGFWRQEAKRHASRLGTKVPCTHHRPSVV